MLSSSECHKICFILSSFAVKKALIIYLKPFRYIISDCAPRSNQPFAATPSRLADGLLEHAAAAAAGRDNNMTEIMTTLVERVQTDLGNTLFIMPLNSRSQARKERTQTSGLGFFYLL